MDNGPDMSALGNALRRLRAHRKLSQKQLAILLGVSESMVSHYERGTRSIGYETLERAIKVLRPTDDEAAVLRSAKKVATDALSTKRHPTDDASAGAIARLLQTLAHENAELREELRLQALRDDARFAQLLRRLELLERRGRDDPPEAPPAAPQRPRKGR